MVKKKMSQYHQIMCDLSVAGVVNLETVDESPKKHLGSINSKQYCTEITFSDIVESGCGTGSDDDNLNSSELNTKLSSDPNSTPGSFSGSDTSDLSNSYDFWNKADNEKNILNSKNVFKERKSSDDSLNFSVYSSIDPIQKSFDSELNITDFLSFVNIEKYGAITNENTVDSKDLKNSSLTKLLSSQICEKICVDNTFDTAHCNSDSLHDSSFVACDQETVLTREPTFQSDKFRTSLLHNKDILPNCNKNITSGDTLINGEANLFLLCDSFSQQNLKLESSNAINCTPICNEKSSSLSEDFNLSDILSSISFEDNNSKNKHLNNALSINRNTTAGLNDCLKNGDSEEFSLNNDSTCKNIGEITLASLAEKHLSMSPTLSTLYNNSTLKIDDCILPLPTQRQISQESLKNKSSDDDLSMLDLLEDLVVKENTLAHENSITSTDSTCKNIDEISLASLAEEHLSVSPSLSTLYNNSTLKNGDCILSFPNQLEISQEGIKNKGFEDDLSILDLLVVKENTLANENSITSNESSTYQIKRDSHNKILPVDDGENILKEIDLTSCLKSNKLGVASSNLPDFQSVSDSNCLETLNLPPFQYFNLLLTEKKNVGNGLVKRERRKNHNQSLFAKALSCKPKENHSALLKVLNLQKTFCQNILNPTIPNTTVKPAKSVIRQSSESVIVSVGRRVFGQGAPCELV